MIFFMKNIFLLIFEILLEYLEKNNWDSKIS